MVDLQRVNEAARKNTRRANEKRKILQHGGVLDVAVGRAIVDARVQQHHPKAKPAAKQQPKKGFAELSRTARNKLLRELRQHRSLRQRQLRRGRPGWSLKSVPFVTLLSGRPRPQRRLGALRRQQQ